MKRGNLLSTMLLTTTKHHGGQVDRAKRPYILHPIHVMMALKTDDEELQCIALGHDLLEDTSCTVNELRELGMTTRIIDGIVALTKVADQSYDDYKQQVFANHDAMLVKRQDLLHNSDLSRLRKVTEKDLARQQRYLDFIAEIDAKLRAHH